MKPGSNVAIGDHWPKVNEPPACGVFSAVVATAVAVVVGDAVPPLLLLSSPQPIAITPRTTNAQRCNLKRLPMTTSLSRATESTPRTSGNTRQFRRPAGRLGTGSNGVNACASCAAQRDARSASSVRDYGRAPKSQTSCGVRRVRKTIVALQAHRGPEQL